MILRSKSSTKNAATFQVNETKQAKNLFSNDPLVVILFIVPEFDPFSSYDLRAHNFIQNWYFTQFWPSHLKISRVFIDVNPFSSHSSSCTVLLKLISEVHLRLRNQSICLWWKLANPCWTAPIASQLMSKLCLVDQQNLFVLNLRKWFQFTWFSISAEVSYASIFNQVIVKIKYCQNSCNHIKFCTSTVVSDHEKIFMFSSWPRLSTTTRNFFLNFSALKII